jgi:hypothetical protein
MPIDDRTTNLNYKLPNAGNFLEDDVPRLREALAAIDMDVTARPTMAEVNQLITDLIGGSPTALNTLNELAAALGGDPNFAATVTTLLGQKANATSVFTKAESDARYVQGQTQAEMVFVATAGQADFTLSTPVINKPSALVTVDGVVQPTSEYSLNMAGTVLTLSEGVPAGTVVRVLALGVSSEGAPGDDTVTTVKLRDGAVTTPKLGDSAVTPSKLSQPLTFATAVATTSGTAIDFTAIPSWARRITVMLQEVSISGISNITYRLGTSAGVTASGYLSSASSVGSGAASFGSLTGFEMYGGGAAQAFSGSITFRNILENAWCCDGIFGYVAGGVPGTMLMAGSIVLNGTLDRLRVTTANGTDVFDAGTVNILYD